MRTSTSTRSTLYPCPVADPARCAGNRPAQPIEHPSAVARRSGAAYQTARLHELHERYLRHAARERRLRRRGAARKSGGTPKLFPMTDSLTTVPPLPAPSPRAFGFCPWWWMETGGSTAIATLLEIAAVPVTLDAAGPAAPGTTLHATSRLPGANSIPASLDITGIDPHNLLPVPSERAALDHTSGVRLAVREAGCNRAILVVTTPVSTWASSTPPPCAWRTSATRSTRSAASTPWPWPALPTARRCWPRQPRRPAWRGTPTRPTRPSTTRKSPPRSSAASSTAGDAVAARHRISA